MEPAAPLEVIADGVGVANAGVLGAVVVAGVVETECDDDVDEAVTEKGRVAVVVGAANEDVGAPEVVLENTKGTNVEVLAGVVVVELEELAAASAEEDAAAELYEVVEGALEDVGASDGGANEVLEDAAAELTEVEVLWASDVVVVEVGSAELVGPADWNPSSC